MHPPLADRRSRFQTALGVRRASGARGILWVVLIVTWGLVACGPAPTPEIPPTATQLAPPATEEETGTPAAEFQGGDRTMTPESIPGATEVEPLAGAQEVVRLALEDLAQKLGLAPEAIRLVSVEAVEWSDTSLGCPQPGMMYAQVITPGFRVVLEANGEQYVYHTDADRFVVLCEK